MNIRQEPISNAGCVPVHDYLQVMSRLSEPACVRRIRLSVSNGPTIAGFLYGTATLGAMLSLYTGRIAPAVLLFVLAGLFFAHRGTIR